MLESESTKPDKNTAVSGQDVMEAAPPIPLLTRLSWNRSLLKKKLLVVLPKQDCVMLTAPPS
jgi:hypothetical protein